MLTTVLAGFGLSLSLIAAIGAQNAFLLRQGIRREHVLVVIVICTLSDAVLMTVGIAGGGAVFASAPVLAEVARWAGAAFLLLYAVFAVRRALEPEALEVDAGESGSASRDGERRSREGADASAIVEGGTTAGAVETRVTAAASGAAGTTTALAAPSAPSPRRIRRSPAAGSLAAVALTALALTWLNPHVYLDTLVLLGSIGSRYGDDRLAFGIGAWAASLLWFTVVGFGARLLAPLFAKPAAWRVLDILVAAIMAVMAVMLIVH
ncbi:LysE/ArgO family amino acid transporter [Schumannella soli]|uniref:Amino acid transporter n=1 Tax=Schumannella soli TaxID=2590779 RepID=A0A506Y8I3_9MICO|nr:LysE/ArgO family amino acid transporter [Schumannella soli]TPW77378.1 amino acid transporter [Schumannella soli]